METPGLTDELIAARLREEYGVQPTRIVPLPLGLDSDARVCRVKTADGHDYFLKIKIARAVTDDLGAAIAYALKCAGIGQIVAPLPTIAGALQVAVGGFALTLSPFVDGPTGWDVGVSVPQWTEFGDILRRVHGSVPSAALCQRLPRERFVPVARWRWVVEGLLGGTYREVEGEAAAELAALVATRQEEIGGLLRRAEELGRRLQGRELPFVLCHADCHTANVLIERAGGLRLVDWEQPMLAPRERDLMFVIGRTLNGFLEGSPEAAAFFAGYGAVEPDPLALAYYRYGWAVEDIGSFAEAVVDRPDIDADGQRDALAGVRSVFAPNGIAEAAYRSEDQLPESHQPPRR